MRKIFVLMAIMFSLTVTSQDISDSIKTKIFTVVSDTIQIDSVSINSFYFQVYTIDKQIINSTYYDIDFAKALLILKNKSVLPSNRIIVEYTELPKFLTRNYSAFDKKILVPKITDQSNLYSFQEKNTNKFTKPFDGLYTSGSLSRGVTVGNNQDAVVNSNFNLQIKGNLAKNIGIRASITDNQIPLQDGGYTQRLDQFDKVFIELFSENWKLTAGDIDLQNSDTYFMRFYKKISGVSVNAKINHNNGETNIFASGAIVRGRYYNFKFNGIDGNQGPYKILGPDNEQFILMVSGSERVFANGVLLRRGENYDYIIDYNTSEITFTTLYTVTSNLRISIEYQIADRNYTRFLTFDGVEYKSDKLKIGVKYFNESDSKNKTIQQDLSDEQKQILVDAGDDKSKMVAPSATLATFSESKILYKKDVQNSIEIFVYSTNPNDELYQVSFTYVGENNGDYIIETTLATGRVYAYVSEINSIKQGAYLPVIKLVAPEKIQMISIDASFKPNKKTDLISEFTFSDKDLNIFSDIDNENNKGFATKLIWNQTILDKKWKLNSSLDYEYIDKDFNTIERFRNIEFSRDWNLVNRTTQISQKQQFIKAGLTFVKDSIGLANYKFEGLFLGENYKGFRHNLYSNINFKSTFIKLDASLLSSETEVRNANFYRFYSNIVHNFSRSWVGGKFNLESNKEIDKATSLTDSISHRYYEAEAYYGIGDSTKVYSEIGYNYRTTDSVRVSNLGNVSKSNTIFLKSTLIQNINTNLGVYINYRQVENKNIPNDKSFNSRVSYRQSLWKNLVVLQTLYQTQTGNLPQQEFTYIEVEPGRGFYEWIDFNNNAVQELDEFVIAQFQDKATFVRVLLPQVNFIKTNQNKFTQAINFSATRWQNKSGFKKIISHFSNQAYFLIDTKTKRESSKLNLNPFSYSDKNLLGLDLNFKNSLFYNRGLQKYSMIYSFINSRKQTVFIFGDQDVKLNSHQFQFIHKLSKFWLLDFLGGISTSTSSSNSFSNRNYEILNMNLNPKISYIYSNNSRLEAFYNYKNKENKLVSFEMLKMHVVGANFLYANKQKFSINANFNLYFNEFTGNQNSPVAYQMLEGLQPGTNITWLLSLQKRLTSFLDLNLNYFGRKSENSKTIHTGNIQLRASF